MLAGHRMHSSHDMHHIASESGDDIIHFCMKCGNYMQAICRGLGQPCKGSLLPKTLPWYRQQKLNKGYHPVRGTFIGRPQRGCHQCQHVPIRSGNTTNEHAPPSIPLGQGKQVSSHDPWEAWAAPAFLLGDDVELEAYEPEFDMEEFVGL